MARKGKILVVDDNQGIRNALKLLLSPHFAEVEMIASPNTLKSTVERMHPDTVLLDMNFYTDINTGNEGLFWMDELKRMYPDMQVVLFTAYADVALAVEGMKRGAFDFVVKPWDNERLIATLLAACTAGSKQQEAKGAAKASQLYWGSSPAMNILRNTVAKLASTDVTVLITGENGTGKDVLANEIHALSPRSKRPMVCVDAGAITETLFESELFGHVKGAFTDARTDHAGKFEQASGSTLFLDEIGNIPPHLQAKLLRVLQSRVVTPVGSEKQIPVDIRLICATNMDLEAMARDGRFRRDLYFRINTMTLHLPPLRERHDDIIPLAEQFRQQMSERYHRNTDGFSPDAVDKLLSHDWPGNVRELMSTIERAVILSEQPTLTSKEIQLERPLGAAATDTPHTLNEAEEQVIREAIRSTNGNLSMVAKQLGISRPTLYAKLKKYGI